VSIPPLARSYWPVFVIFTRINEKERDLLNGVYNDRCVFVHRAKMKGFPPWPGRVSIISEFKFVVLILFFKYILTF
jgi:hypothetical protein